MLVRFEKLASKNQGTRPFRFLAPWLIMSISILLLRKCGILKPTIALPLPILSWRSKSGIGRCLEIFFRENEDLMARINGIQAALENYSSRGLVRLEARLRNELERVMGQEKILWWQKSQKDELLRRDMNTNFFHQKTIVRRRRNRIEAIQDSSGNWIYSEEEIRNHAIGYFSALYKSEAATPQRYSVQNLFPVLNASELENTADPVLDDEIKRVVFSMKLLKAPSTDGLHAIFYQTQ